MEVKVVNVQELLDLIHALPDKVMLVVDFGTGEIECVD